ncbi:MAG: YpmA family protein [Heliobacteriaceae bacterium]|nr:YpmA family protein [Heliobacteriaceae bacterium]MDD4586792.1 YpmA family protein [Heliobacteriaceae bacterium]
MPKQNSSAKLEVLSTKTLPANPDLYKVVDFLNKNLKHKNLMFGLSKNADTMTISIYEV